MKNVTTIEQSFISTWISDVMSGKIEKTTAINNICEMFKCSFFEALEKWNTVFDKTI